MKKKDVPQDLGPLKDFSKEVMYTSDESGKYDTTLSQGWKVKEEALDKAWEDIEQRIANAKEKVLRKEASPLLYFMEKQLMDIGVLAGYTGFWRWSVKRHLQYSIFQKLSDKKLEKYAEVFGISVAALKKMEDNG